MPGISSVEKIVSHTDKQSSDYWILKRLGNIGSKYWMQYRLSLKYPMLLYYVLTNSEEIDKFCLI